MMHNFEGIFVLHPAVQGLEMIYVKQIVIRNMIAH